jgi:hypothetical protein
MQVLDDAHFAWLGFVRASSGPNRQFTLSDDITFLVIDFR